VYFGSALETTPASNTPKRCSTLPPSSARPAIPAATRLRRAAVTAMIAPPSVRHSASRRSRFGRPVVQASVTVPGRRSISKDAVNSATAPTAASRRAGPASATGAHSMPRPPPLAAADPVNTNGSSFRLSCQAGTAVCASSAAVYEATPGAMAAAARPAGRAAAASRRPGGEPRSERGSSSAAAARPLPGL
jgi:hypothetical protein